uniref:Uncharacterized protein n=1 Tax=Arundo donax TaxID=35708 RepID=A0A0A9CR29_ARUDO
MNNQYGLVHRSCVSSSWPANLSRRLKQ